MQFPMFEGLIFSFASFVIILTIGAIIAICCQTKWHQQRLAPMTVAGNARDAKASAENASSGERNLNLNKWPGTRTATKRQNNDQIILAPITEKEFAKKENQEQYASSEATVTHELEAVRYSSLSEIESTVSTTIFRNDNSEEPKHNEDDKNLQKSTEFTSSILLDPLEATMEKHSNFSTSDDVKLANNHFQNQ